jgi:hypothetical protein
MLNSIKSFMQDESGLETVEWAIGGDVSRGLDSLGAETSAIQ